MIHFNDVMLQKPATIKLSVTSHDDLDVSFSPPSLDFMLSTVRFSVFVEGEKLMTTLLLQGVGPDFILGFPDHPMFCVTQVLHLVLFVLVCQGVPCIYRVWSTCSPPVFVILVD